MLKTRAARILILPALVVVLVAALALSACSSDGPKAASVGDHVITPEETAEAGNFFSLYIPLTSDLAHSHGPPTCALASPATTDSTAELTEEAEREACERIALTSLIQSVVVDDYAEEHGITPSDQDMQDWLTELRADVGEETLETGMAENEVTDEQLDAFAREQILFGEVKDAIVETRLTEDRVQEAYEESRMQLSWITTQRIVLETKAEAQRVYEEMSAPSVGEEEFEAAARKYSILDGVDENGGLVEEVPASGVDPAYGEAAMSLEEGQVAEPVETDSGWEVIRLVKKRTDPLELVREQLVAIYGPEEFAKWIREELEDRGVEVDPAFGVYDWDILSVVSKAFAEGNENPPSESESPSP